MAEWNYKNDWDAEFAEHTWPYIKALNDSFFKHTKAILGEDLRVRKADLKIMSLQQKTRLMQIFACCKTDGISFPEYCAQHEIPHYSIFPKRVIHDRKAVDSLTDTYVKKKLGVKDVSSNIVAVKREQLKLNRKINEKQREINNSGIDGHDSHEPQRDEQHGNL